MSKKPRQPLSPEVLRELPQRMLNSAEAFFFAGIICSADFDPSPLFKGEYRNVEFAAADINNSSNKIASLGAPPIVNLSFAIELYFKILLQCAGIIIPREHGHRALFEALKHGAPHVAQQIIEIHDYARGDEEDFFEYLSSIDSSFADWRYAHEKDFLIISADSLLAMATALRRVIGMTHPELVSVFAPREDKAR